MKFYNSYYERMVERDNVDYMCECLELDADELGIAYDELLVMSYMFKYIFITNRECRENMGFGKTKSAKIFKKLIELGLIDKHGAGAGTYYMLKEEGYTGNDADYNY